MVVHVEPITEGADLRERVHEAAVGVRRVREVHNLSLVQVDGHTELSLHVKLPGDLTLEEAHAIAEELEAAICAAVPEISGVQTHLEPLAEERAAREVRGRRRGGRARASSRRRPASRRGSCASCAPTTAWSRS